MAEKTITPKTPIWIRLTLLISLAANLLIVGLAAGFFISGGPERRALDGPRPDGGSLFTRALDPRDRRAVRRDYVSRLDGQPRDRGAAVADMRSTLQVLRQTPFDPDAFVAAMGQQSERRVRRDQVGREVLAARLAAMSDGERAAYADRVEQGLDDLAKRVRK